MNINTLTYYYIYRLGLARVMVSNATFKNISAISWRSVLLGGGNWNVQ